MVVYSLDTSHVSLRILESSYQTFLRPPWSSAMTYLFTSNMQAEVAHIVFLRKSCLETVSDHTKRNLTDKEAYFAKQLSVLSYIKVVINCIEIASAYTIALTALS